LKTATFRKEIICTIYFAKLVSVNFWAHLFSKADYRYRELTSNQGVLKEKVFQMKSICCLSKQLIETTLPRFT